MSVPKINAPSLTLAFSGGHEIDKGAYSLKVNLTPASADARIFLFADNPSNSLDITAGASIESILALLDATMKWGQFVQVWAEARASNQSIATSNKINLRIHVKPLPANITFDVLARERLTYPGNGFGRTLTKQRINNKWYFRHGSILECNPAMRGFDCTTFLMSIFNTYPVMSGAYGTKLADALGAQKCDLEMLQWTQVRDMFKATEVPYSAPPLTRSGPPSFIKRDPFAKATIADSFDRSGVYIIWSAGHIVLYQDGMIHEYTFGGYKTTPAQFRDWSLAPQGLWWIRRLPPHLRA